jgi:hypothetical protein
LIDLLAKTVYTWKHGLSPDSKKHEEPHIAQRPLGKRHPSPV